MAIPDFPVINLIYRELETDRTIDKINILFTKVFRYLQTISYFADDTAIGDPDKVSRMLRRGTTLYIQHWNESTDLWVTDATLDTSGNLKITGTLSQSQTLTDVQ